MDDIYRKTISSDEIIGYPAFVYDGDVIVIEETEKWRKL